MPKYLVSGTVEMEFHQIVEASSKKAAKEDAKIEVENGDVEFSGVSGEIEINTVNEQK